ncbi:MAG TPA: GGDEF domain-containing protein [Burkholderiales bacterium]|nr:GGDEF domain-containing protein [Burkholderiales bacterium]
MNDRLRELRPFWAPAAIVAAAALLVWMGRPLPASLSGLRTAGPYAVLIAALALAWWFNRGRSFVIAASLLGAFAAWSTWHTKAMYTLVVVLVPLNALWAMTQAERGARYRAAYWWLALLAAEGLLIWWIGSTHPRAAAVDEWFLLRSPPTPLAGRLMFAAAFAAAVWRAWPEFRPIPVGNAAAVAAFFLAAEWAGSSGAYAVFMGATGVVLIAALLHESHQLAFRDQLTGLPGRRALEERMRSLGERYAIGMVDVDHFKQFNDTHGHEVGDQVLKLVGGRLAEVEGGGIAYRYGGEEFSVLFPGSNIAEAQQALEAIRGSIEAYRMAVRGADRPKATDEGARRRGERTGDKTLSVTVSIGVAAPSDERATPRTVLRASDEALYRAKKAGRNRVSR